MKYKYKLKIQKQEVGLNENNKIVGTCFLKSYSMYVIMKKKIVCH